MKRVPPSVGERRTHAGYGGGNELAVVDIDRLVPTVVRE